MAASATAPAPARWGILATIPRVCAADADLPPGHADLSFELAEPPAISVLTVARRVSPDRLTKRNFPSVLAAHPSGLLLLHATQGITDHAAGPVVVYGAHGDGTSARKLVTCRREFVHGYFVCDARSATASRLPDPQSNRILDAGNLGLLTRDGGRTYLLAELQPIVGSPAAILLRYSSETGCWASKVLDYPLHDVVRPWAAHGVVSLGERLWWCDVSWGLITCLPFEEEPVLQFVPLPRADILPFHRTAQDLQRHACFAVSDGAVRFVKIGVPSRPKVTVQRLKHLTRRHGEGNHPWVTMYTLCSAEDGSSSWSWRIDHEVSFSDIWSHETYEATGLPKKDPKLACVDPCNADIVYFFLGRYIFSVDLGSGTLQKYARFNMKTPTAEYMSSRFVLACELAPRAPGV